jgi:hypothetical protein
MDNQVMEKFNVADVANKLFCTFTAKENLDSIIETITAHYSIMYGKIFVLEPAEGTEYLCTYNIDPNNSSTYVLPSTILLHRKKETNTLYTINGLNALIAQINNGIIDSSFRVNWPDYRNTVLLTQGTELRKLETKIHKIIQLQ